MRLSHESYEYIRLKFALLAEQIGNKHREAIRRIRELTPRGGAMEAAIDDEEYQNTSELVDAKVNLLLEAFERERVVPSQHDIDEICQQLDTFVSGARQNPFRSRLVSSYERYNSLVPKARLTLFAAMNRKKVELAVAMRDATPASAPERLFVDDIENFQAVRAVSPSDLADLLADGFIDVSEETVQVALEQILAVPMHKRDWGGEINDLYTANMLMAGRRVGTAFLLKGNGLRRRMMELSDCGKNGDQILRLLESPASVFVVQYVGNISENVVRDIAGKIAQLRGQNRTAYYCIIDGQDTARLLRAYRKL